MKGRWSEPVEAAKVRAHCSLRARAAGLCLLAAGLLLASCQTDGPSKAQYEAQSAELLKSRQETADAQIKLDQAEQSAATLTQTLGATTLKLQDLETRTKAQENHIKELEAVNAKLQDLLNEVQMLQLDKLVDSSGLELDNLQSSTIAVAGTTPPDANTEALTGQTANPADTTPPAANLSPADATSVAASDNLVLDTLTMPPDAQAAINPQADPVPAGTPTPAAELVPADTEPVPAPVASQAPVVIDSAAVLAEAAALVAAAKAPVKAAKPGALGIGLGLDVFNRVERKDQRGTELIAERDSVTGVNYLYHRQAWYDKPGVFVEFSKPAGGKYTARLVIQIPDQAEAPADGASEILVNGQSLGQALASRPLVNGDSHYLYAAFALDERLAARLKLLMAEGALNLNIRRDGQTGSDFAVSPAMRSTLREMLDALRDLR